MTDELKHECGIALLRLFKPASYFQEKYGYKNFGLSKLYMLMEKQQNRGQDGAGVVNIKLGMPPGKKYIFRERSNKELPIRDVFERIEDRIKTAIDHTSVKGETIDNLPFTGELFLGHLRYGTYGGNNIESVHPITRQNNWKARNLVLAGNFNLTNVDEIIEHLVSLGQHPKDYSDTVTVLENIGHFLDIENQRLFDEYHKKGFTNIEISDLIQKNIDIQKILKSSSKRWDGGFVVAGLIGHGDAFVLRDAHGIRPAYYFYNDEFAVITSERPVIQTILGATYDQIKEVTPGCAVIIKENGEVSEKRVFDEKERKACSFERIYFSRGGDKEIYTERKNLGRYVSKDILKTIDFDIDNSVFSFIPNTAESAFFGMVKEIQTIANKRKIDELFESGQTITKEHLYNSCHNNLRVEKLAIKDVKMRTFITENSGRDDMVGNVYDITYGTVVEGKDNLIVIDDSIVRGTTLQKSVIRILDRLNPKRIVIVSSSPQIRYPDCYGIDMSVLGDFIAFKAAIALLREAEKNGNQELTGIIDEVYRKSKLQEKMPKEEVVNHVKEIYAPFTYEQISSKIAELVTAPDIKAKVDIVYQSIENLHRACPKNTGDWYFTGNYPTPGGNKVANKAFINFIEGKKGRAY